MVSALEEEDSQPSTRSMFLIASSPPPSSSRHRAGRCFALSGNQMPPCRWNPTIPPPAICTPQCSHALHLCLPGPFPFSVMEFAYRSEDSDVFLPTCSETLHLLHLYHTPLAGYLVSTVFLGLHHPIWVVGIIHFLIFPHNIGSLV